MGASTTTSATPTTRRRNRRGEGALLRDVLIDAATRLVSERGDGTGLSLRQVAAEAGVAPTSIYPHFDDLDALLQAVARRGLGVFSAARNAAVAEASSPDDALIRGCLAYVQFAVDHPGLYRLAFSGGRRPTMSLWANPRGNDGGEGSAAYDGLVSSIAKVQAAGLATTSDPPERLAALVWPSLHGIAMLRIDRPGLPLPDHVELVRESVHRLVGLA